MKDLINEAEELRIKCKIETDAAIYYAMCIDESLKKLSKSKKNKLFLK